MTEREKKSVKSPKQASHFLKKKITLSDAQGKLSEISTKCSKYLT